MKWKLPRFAWLILPLLTACGGQELEDSRQIYQRKNSLLNSNFDLWQRGLKITYENQEEKYGADRWFLRNTLGDGSEVTFTRVTATNPGSHYGAAIQIQTAPVDHHQNGVELFQTLESADSISLIGENVTFSAQVKALGRVNRIGLQVMYQTEEYLADRPWGEEKVVEVNATGFTRATLAGIPIDDRLGRKGVIGVRVRIVDVVQGNPYDVKNGFVIEQAMLNPGIVAPDYQRREPTIETEIRACQRYYEKSFALERYEEADKTLIAMLLALVLEGTGRPVSFKVTKRSAEPRVRMLEEKEGKLIFLPNETMGDRNYRARNANENGFNVAGPEAERASHWIADAEIYPRPMESVRSRSSGKISNQ